MKIELLHLKEKILQWCHDNKTGKERLVILSTGDNSASEVYMRNKVDMGGALSIPTVHYDCLNKCALEQKIYECNRDKVITGIIVQLPLPKGWDEDYFINLISPEKDVDMLTDTNKCKMMLGQTKLLPATASGCMMVLDTYFDTLEGKDVTLIGRSDLVNNPLYHALMKRNATITHCHSKTQWLSTKCRGSHIIISAAGVPGLINRNFIGESTEMILDVSISRVDGKIVGDVREEIYDMVDVTANPRGLGALTVGILFMNLILITKGELN